MDIETIRNYCLSLPMTSEDMAFGEDHLLVRVCDKIFGCLDLIANDFLVLKADPEYAIELRDRYPEIEPAWHWNKKYWIQLSLSGKLKEELILSLIRHSYSEVVRKLPKRIKTEHPELTSIS